MQRSIPASAGQPLIRSIRSSPRKVYPRECGAALLIQRMRTMEAGLSPRVRGSPSELSSSGEFQRSIPASAGQPAGRLER